MLVDNGYKCVIEVIECHTVYRWQPRQIIGYNKFRIKYLNCIEIYEMHTDPLFKIFCNNGKCSDVRSLKDFIFLFLTIASKYNSSIFPDHFKSGNSKNPFSSSFLSFSEAESYFIRSFSDLYSKQLYTH